MVTIRTATQVNAPMERCFRLSLSIDLEMAANRYRAVAGVTKGLIGPGESVTWQGRQFGLTVRHESLIDIWRPYSYFREVMVAGTFGAYQHDHHFAVMNDGTRIRDEIRFAAPAGLLGRVAEKLVLRRRITAMLQQRNAFIKQVAESDEWHRYLDGQPELDQRVYQALSASHEPEDRAYAE
jgi:ligand-binding SRPBCC domain-containing protein